MFCQKFIIFLAILIIFIYNISSGSHRLHLLRYFFHS